MVTTHAIEVGALEMESALQGRHFFFIQPPACYLRTASGTIRNLLDKIRHIKLSDHGVHYAP